MEKTCKKCEETKHIVEFKIFSKGEISEYCKLCYEFDPNETREGWARYSNQPTEHREKQLKRNFNITLEDYNEMFARQEGKCAICKIHQKYLKVTLAVDHNHSTGKVRGLLCSNCNTGLGHFKENPNLFDRAKEYLVNYTTIKMVK